MVNEMYNVTSYACNVQTYRSKIEGNMMNNEATIEKLRKLIVSPEYTEKPKGKLGKIDKDALLKKAQRVAENLDKNDSLSSPTPA